MATIVLAPGRAICDGPKLVTGGVVGEDFDLPAGDIARFIEQGVLIEVVPEPEPPAPCPAPEPEPPSPEPEPKPRKRKARKRKPRAKPPKA